jgi:hypothetical protein
MRPKKHLALALLLACATGAGAADTPSLVIAPMLSGSFYCEESLHNPAVPDEDAAARLCATLGKTAAPRIESFLAGVGPARSPSGQYQLGYTLIVPLFRYFRQVDGAWVLDEGMLRANLQTIAQVERPVVVHLSSTHFAFSGLAFSRALARDARNLQWTRKGPARPADFFTVPVVPWTLADADAPVNKLRRQAFGAAVDALCALPAAARERIVGVSLLGETHEVFPSAESGPGYDIRNDQRTDYSPAMAEGFRTWLAQRYGSIEALNHYLQGSYASFAAIEPPRRDLRTEVLGTFFEHMDNHAAGRLQVYGWVHDRRGRRLTVRVLVDGREVGIAETGYSRIDVREALDLRDANVGFRHDLDFRQLAYGGHTVDVLVSADGAPPVLLGRRQIVHQARRQGPWTSHAVAASAALPLAADPALSGYLDGPPAGPQSVFYNPLAELWLEFRNLVVRNYVDQFARIAGRSCIPASKVFSHQIVPGLYGNWNSDVLAVDASLRNSDSHLPGVSLYGGSAVGGAFTTLKRRLGWARYGVGELHPMMPLGTGGHAAMFELHRTGGAVYVAPYYMSMIPGDVQGGAGLDRFLIAPGNRRYGSDQFYRAIGEVLRR